VAQANEDLRPHILPSLLPLGCLGRVEGTKVSAARLKVLGRWGRSFSVSGG
jgi:hypothetical protein